MDQIDGRPHKDRLLKHGSDFSQPQLNCHGNYCKPLSLRYDPPPSQQQVPIGSAPVHDKHRKYYWCLCDFGFFRRQLNHCGSWHKPPILAYDPLLTPRQAPTQLETSYGRHHRYRWN